MRWLFIVSVYYLRFDIVFLRYLAIVVIFCFCVIFFKNLELVVSYIFKFGVRFYCIEYNIL